MQPYPNYSQPMMNSPYQSGYNPMLSPQQRLMQMEQQYPQFSQQNQFMVPTQMSGASQPAQGIVGKIVNDFSELTANDVPMNGSAAFFPKADQNQADGSNIPQMDFNALNEDVRALREDIKGVREMIEKSMTVPMPKTTSSRAKKGADEE